MLEGKNDLYERLKKQNGEDDILKNTLIIVDEAHKLYSKDLVAMEKPNMNIVEKKINESDSCKVLLMTGTPIADEPIEFIKLMNLIMKKDKFPTSFNEFKDEFMDGNNYSTKGRKEFQQRTKGLISYLDRRFDPRQFTQPVFHKKPVRMSIANDDKEQCMKNAANNYSNCLEKVIVPDNSNLNNLKEDKERVEQEIAQLKIDLNNDKKNTNIKSLIALKKENLKFIRQEIVKQNKTIRNEKKLQTSQERACKKEMRTSEKKCETGLKKRKEYFQNLVIKNCK
jgi:hypothetical protein